MNTKPSRRLFMMLPLLVWLGACVGTQTFTPVARQGDTVALGVGWQKSLVRQDVTVTITDALGTIVTYAPNDPRVRGIVNMYPDPVSRAVVGTMSNQDLGYDATSTGSLINGSVTQSSTGEHDNEWWQTVLLLDLPNPLAPGTAKVSITDSAGAVIKPASITIVSGTGSSNQFNVYGFGSTFSILSPGVYPNALMSFERADRYTVTFASTVIPHSIQLQFTHTPNVGKTWIVNPRGDIKNVVWNDDGTNIRVMLTPANGETLQQMLDYKFYIAGGITGLTQTNLKAYDVNGLPMSGVTASIQ